MPYNTFPKLRPGNHGFTSPFDARYNCIAWAVGDKTRWWWPSTKKGAYWPPQAPIECTVAAFIIAFGTLGYEVCDSSICEAGYEKIAIYTDADNIPTHASRQLINGNWVSKLGRNVDMWHELTALNGKEYGSPTVFLKRKQDRAKSLPID